MNGRIRLVVVKVKSMVLKAILSIFIARIGKSIEWGAICTIILWLSSSISFSYAPSSNIKYQRPFQVRSTDKERFRLVHDIPAKVAVRASHNDELKKALLAELVWPQEEYEEDEEEEEEQKPGKEEAEAETKKGKGKEKEEEKDLVPKSAWLKIQSKEEFLFRWKEDLPWITTQDTNFTLNTLQDLAERLPTHLPRPDDSETILNFAKMSANSYLGRRRRWGDAVMGDWRNLTRYEDEDDFGWDGTGLRGHVFVNDAHTIVIISFKGTSTILHGGETVARDKYMDNIMFSCCCARVDLSWTPVCGCYKGSSNIKKKSEKLFHDIGDTLQESPLNNKYPLLRARNQCDRKCLESTIRDDPDSYFNEASAVTRLVMAKYPRAQIWFTGHSLGGAMASLMAVAIKRTAAITFAAPGPLLYARHLGLHKGQVEGTQWQYAIWNYGLASDPIFMGTCTGLATSCYLSGYAIETACRHGLDCRYNVTSWQPDVATHRIDWMIDHVLSKPEKHPLPLCVPNRICADCLEWEYI